MIINPTKKALPIFSKLPKMVDKDAGTQKSLDAPFFSWTANYFTVERKKIVILINELTLSPVALVDMNAENKKHLPEFFKEGLRMTMIQSGIDPKYVNRYLIKMGKIQINATSNRSILGVLNDYIFHLKYQIDDIGLTITNEGLAERLTRSLISLPIMVTKKVDYHFSADALKVAVQQQLS